ncbi:MAG: tail fiber domain-containing protein [Chthonomonadaceae bacterium]|nr:tail fiber domain-containing protein [Chthonomonadaceae bacterium]
MKRFSPLLVATYCLGATVARAQTAPAGLTFQGRLTTLAGQPVPNGTTKIRVRIFDAPSGGTRLWTSGEGNGQELTVPVRNGVFSTVLSQGFNSSNQALTIGPPVFQGGVIYVEVQPLNQTPIVPRTQIWSAPWAFWAQTVSDDSVTSSKLAADPSSFSKMSDGNVVYLPGTTTLLAPHLQAGNIRLDNGTGSFSFVDFLDGFGGAVRLKTDGLRKFAIECSETIIEGKLGVNSLSAPTSELSVNGSASVSGSLTVAPTSNGTFTLGNIDFKTRYINNSPALMIDPKNAEQCYIFNQLGKPFPAEVIIGSTEPQGSCNVQMPGSLSIGDGYINPAGADCLAVYGRAFKSLGGGSWEGLSDARAKKDIRPIDNPLSRLLSLSGRAFEFKDPKAQHEIPGQRYGFIAQEVEKVFPSWVFTPKNGYKTMSLPFDFSALTVESIRQLSTEVNVLKRENAELRRKLSGYESLDQRLRKLESTNSHGLK